MSEALRSLYVCYLSLEDPLVHSQVVSYLKGLAACGHTVHLLTFDRDLRPDHQRELARSLARRGITWHSLRYHKRPSLPATVYDALAGAVAAIGIMRRHRLNAIHARNHVPAATALIVKRLTNCRMIFDLRGLMAEEYVDAGHWRRRGLAYRITNWIQRAALHRADGIVMLTNAVRRLLFAGDSPSAPLAVIPCCADLTSFNHSAPDSPDTRAELALGDRPILAYVGKFTGWYMEREMVEFFAAARRLRPGLVFLVITQADREIIEREFAAAGIPQNDYRIMHAAPGEIGPYLEVADVGLAFVRPCMSKVSSSPTKVGEYLAAGIPVMSTAGIGDVDQLLTRRRVGVLVRDFHPAAYAAAAEEAFALAADPDARVRCRHVAKTELSLETVGVPRYDALYRKVANAS